MKPCLLVVDDEAHVTRALQRLFHSTEFECLTANSGEEALRLLDRGEVHVVVADEKMPGMPGSRLLAEVRRKLPGAGRILLTGHATIEAAVTAVNEGEVHRFLLKPCDEELLLKNVREVLHEQLRKAEAQVILHVLKAEEEQA